MNYEKLNHLDFIGIYRILNISGKTEISDDLKVCTQAQELQIRKEKKGPNAWCQTSKYTRKQIKIVEASTSDNPTLTSEWGDDSEQITEFHILFGKKLNIGDTFTFSYMFSQPLESTTLSNIPLLTTTSLITIPKAYGTHCDSFEWEIHGPSKSRILQSLPPWQVRAQNELYLSTRLRPHEFMSAVFLLHKGPVNDKVAKILVSTGGALFSGGVGYLISLAL